MTSRRFPTTTTHNPGRLSVRAAMMRSIEQLASRKVSYCARLRF